jgi:CheY-like chemotaxis protein
MSGTPLKFLLVDDNSDSRFLLAKTIQRKFPGGVIVECETSASAVTFISEERPSIVVAHRGRDCDGATLIRTLRQYNQRVPIVMVSGIDREAAAKNAGATRFLHYDQWLRIGTVVSELLSSAGVNDPLASRRG